MKERRKMKLIKNELEILGQTKEKAYKIGTIYRPAFGGQAVPLHILGQADSSTKKELLADAPHGLGHWPVFTDASAITKDKSGIYWAFAAYSADAYSKTLKNGGVGGWVVDGMMQIYSFDGLKWYSYRLLPREINITRDAFIDEAGKFTKDGRPGDIYMLYDNSADTRPPFFARMRHGFQTPTKDIELGFKIGYEQAEDALTYTKGGSDCTLGRVGEKYVMTGQSNDNDIGKINFWGGKNAETMRYLSSWQPYGAKYRIECQSIPMEVVDIITGKKVWVLSYCVQNQNKGEDVNSWDNWFEISVGQWDGKTWTPLGAPKRMTYGWDQYAGNLSKTQDPCILLQTSGAFNWNRYNQDQNTLEVGQYGGFSVPMKVFVQNGEPMIADDPDFSEQFKHKIGRVTDSKDAIISPVHGALKIEAIFGGCQVNGGTEPALAIIDGDNVIALDGTGTFAAPDCQAETMPYNVGDKVTMILDNGLFYVYNMTKGTRSISMFQCGTSLKLNASQSVAEIYVI